MDDYRIAELAQKYTDHDMIRKHTQLPHYPDARTRLLYIFLKGGRNTWNFSELFSLVASLVQMGLDTHDLVQLPGELDKRETLRSKQLKVLAGDYFSSRFYQLLAHEGRIDMIGKLSRSICEINRVKMNAYQRMKQLSLSAEEYIRSMVQINSELFLSFTDQMEGLFHACWPDVLHGFANCEVLVAEIARCRPNGSFKESWGYWHLLQNADREEKRLLTETSPDPNQWNALIEKHQIRPKLFRILEDQVNGLLRRVEGLRAETIGSELLQLIQPFKRYVAQPMVMEGEA